jgi:hypothetical protein
MRLPPALPQEADMSREQEQERIAQEQAIADLLVALARAHNDPIRPQIPETGIEERDLAFEADLLSPPEMEMTVYATRKRRRVLFLLRQLEERGWARLEQSANGAYRAFLLPQGAAEAQRFVPRPWWQRVMGRFVSGGEKR